MRWRRGEEEFRREIESHIDLETDRLIAEGVPPDEARATARRRFGNVTSARERFYESRRVMWIEDFRRDIVLAARAFRKAPGFVAVAVLSLAIGIGANTAVFSIVNGLMLRTLPVEDPHRLVVVSSRDAINEGWRAGWDEGIWEQLRAQTSMFSGSAAWFWPVQPLNLAPRGEALPVEGLFVSGEFFDTLGVKAYRGRVIGPADDMNGGGPDGVVAVVSYDLWRRQFDGSPDTIGRQLSFGDTSVTIVGIAPPDFTGPDVGRAFDVALPLRTAQMVQPFPPFVSVALRLTPEQTIEGATALLQGLHAPLFDAAQAAGTDVPDQAEFLGNPIVLRPAATGESELRRQYGQPLLILFSIVVVVLLVGCVNLANLLVARAHARRHELSVRVSLGAGRGRLLRQLLTESLLLSAAGAAVGLLLASWAADAMVAQMSSDGLRAALAVPLDGRVLAFTAGVTVATALLFGAAPAVTATRIAPLEAVNDRTGWRIHGRGPGRLAGGLTTVQVALSLVLLVCAALLLQTFRGLVSVPLGFQSEPVLVVDIDATAAASDPGQQVTTLRALTTAVDGLPGVQSAAISISTPVNFRPTVVVPIEVPGSGAPPNGRPFPAYLVGPDWFATLGSRILVGRDFDARDGWDAPPVALVNEEFARAYFPEEPVLGQSVIMPMPAPGDVREVRIVGVAENAVRLSPRDAPMPVIYLPLEQLSRLVPLTNVSLSVRAAVEDPVSLAPTIASTLVSVEPALTFTVNRLDERVRMSLSQERLLAALSGVFGGLTLLLSALGLYGVTSDGVVGRRAEIAIRIALGGPRARVVWQLVARVAVSSGCGLLLGLLGAVVATRYLEGLLFGVTPLDATTFAAVSMVFIVVALLATLLPARRATKIDPMVALRCQ
jgi:predicted permease